MGRFLAVFWQWLQYRFICLFLCLTFDSLLQRCKWWPLLGSALPFSYTVCLSNAYPSVTWDFRVSTNQKKGRGHDSVFVSAQAGCAISAGQVPFVPMWRSWGVVAFRHLEGADLEGGIGILCSSEERTGTCGLPLYRWCQLSMGVF